MLLSSPLLGNHFSPEPTGAALKCHVDMTLCHVLVPSIDLIQPPLVALAIARSAAHGQARPVPSDTPDRGRTPPVPLTSRPMITLRVDLASQPERTATCRIRWRTASAAQMSKRTLEGRHGFTPPRAVPRSRQDRNRRPVRLARELRPSHSRPLDRHGLANRDVADLGFRRTDRVVRERLGRWPLSVSADRIAMTTVRGCLSAGMTRAW